MKTLSLREVAELLDVPRTAIEQHVTRGNFLPAMGTVPGKAREWTRDETYRLGAFMEAVRIGVPGLPAGANLMSGLLPPVPGRANHLVLWQDAENRAWWREDFPAGGPPDELATFLANPKVASAVVVPLDRIYAIVSAAFPDDE
jgi:hypothetical protein